MASYTYMNEIDIDAELKCMICEEPFQVPVNCVSCGQTFCQSCITRWTCEKPSCPSCRCVGNVFPLVISRVVRNQLDRLIVKCSLCQRDNIQRSNFPDHTTSTCPKQIIDCRNRCGWKGCRENSEAHVRQCRGALLGRWPVSWWWALVNVLLVIFYFYTSARR